jgi:transaldolase/glucose-6-phosphate isomerase
MFFLWEMAIAAAGAVIAINPFDQPDVEAQKIKTRAMTEEYERNGTLPEQTPVATFDGVAVFSDERNAKSIAGAKTLSDCLRALLDQLGSRDYFALLAYIEQNEAHEAAIGAIRARVRDVKRAATVCGFGPRYLHSTGQAYKGGPNEGVFITITGEHGEKVALAGGHLDFGTVQLAQAIGDFAVLNERGRRAIRLHLGNIEGGLGALRAAIEQALT